MTMRRSSGVDAWLQLTKLFLRQFLENDLVSPDSDRAQLLAVVGAGVVSLTLFLSMFLSAPYSMSRLTPGQAAILTLNDKFFYVSLAMLITAMVAAAQWDALSLDHRDSAILDPLPVRPSIVRAAKLTAIAMLGAVVALAVNAFPSFVFPWMLSFSLRQMSASDVFRLMGVHAMVTVTAAVFGYLAVMTVRETLSAVLGPKLFSRWSPTFQAAMIVGLGSLILLMPPASTRIAQRGFSGWMAQSPPMAFVALYELASREFIVDLPRGRMPPRMARRDPEPTALYQQRRPLFAPLAQRVRLLFLGALGLLVVSTVISGLRAPVGGALLIESGRRRSRIFERMASVVIARDPAARAGFHFALSTMFRSKTHRLTLACAAAVGVALTFVILSRLDLQNGGVGMGLLLIQPVLYGCLLVGFRHLVRVPAELRASWGFQLAWRGRRRAFTAGVCRAAMLFIALPAVFVTSLPVAVVAGGATAAAHALLGMAGAAILLEALMLGFDKAPFTCSYVPSENAKGVMPLYVIAFSIGASLFARVELAILAGPNWIGWTLMLGIVFAALRIAAVRRQEKPVEFNELPESAQTLGLSS
jgi:hypothetical protein